MVNDLDITYIQSNVQNNIEIIKTMFIILCTYYTNLKLLNKKENIHPIDIVSVIISAIICGIIKNEVNFLIYIVFTIVILSLITAKNNIIKSIITTIISLAINYVIFIASIAINFIFDFSIELHNDYLNLIVIVILYMILIYAFLSIKKLKYGISFLQKNMNNEFEDILILNIGVIILFIITLMANANIVLVKNAIPSGMLFAIIMFITIQKSLQLYYKQKLLVQELNETKEELAKKARKVEELEAENLSFSKKSHTLVHKQKSLEYKLQEMTNKTEISKEEAAEVRDRLKEIEKDLYKEKTTIELDKTGITEIDDMLKYMQSECNKNKIDFELQLKGNIYYMINNLIEKQDLEILIADHIKNAIIAINHTDNINRSILVRLGKIDETYGLYIYDSGIEFESETLKNIGKKPSTTHTNEGGTGMGFMNTFDTLRKCKASLIIDEYNEPSKDNYTKAIMIKFDNKNEFKIKSYREQNVV